MADTPKNNPPRDRSGIHAKLNKLPGSSRVVCKPIEYKINLSTEEEFESCDKRLEKQQAENDKKYYPGKAKL